MLGRSVFEESGDGGRRIVSTTAEGTVIEALPNAMFKVELADGRKVVAHVGGALRLNVIRILPGQQVTLELSPYDPTRGRIVRRDQ